MSSKAMWNDRVPLPGQLSHEELIRVPPAPVTESEPGPAHAGAAQSPGLRVLKDEEVGEVGPHVRLLAPATTHGHHDGKARSFAPRGFGFTASFVPARILDENGDAEAYNVYLVAVWIALKGKLSWGTAGIVIFSVCLSLLQTATLLNLAWILNDQRVVDLLDTFENYDVTMGTEYLPAGTKNSTTAYHKHLVNQDDRFCWDVTSGTAQHVYFNCLWSNSMTTWDLFTLALLCVAFYEKLNDGHLELVYQVMLGVSGLQDATLSPIRRVWVTLALAIRCLQEALFVAISVTIVAAAKGTLQMILNSLAISFFADLDNLAWDKLLLLVPSLNAIREEASASLNGPYRSVADHMEKGKTLCMWFSVLVTLMYYIMTIVFKSPDMYTFLDQRASPDTNIPSSLFIIPILIFLILLVALCGRLSSQTARLQSTVSDLRVSMGDIEVFTVLICIHVITVAINLFFYCVGMVEGVIGAGCAWRFSAAYAAILSIPTFLSHFLVHMKLIAHKRKHVWLGRVLHFTNILLSAVAIGLALFLTLSPSIASYTGQVTGYNNSTTYSCHYQAQAGYNWKCLLDEQLMGGDTYFREYCLCGYSGWSPDYGVLNSTSDYCQETYKTRLPYVFLDSLEYPPGYSDDS